MEGIVRLISVRNNSEFVGGIGRSEGRGARRDVVGSPAHQAYFKLGMPL